MHECRQIIQSCGLVTIVTTPTLINIFIFIKSLQYSMQQPIIYITCLNRSSGKNIDSKLRDFEFHSWRPPIYAFLYIIKHKVYV